MRLVRCLATFAVLLALGLCPLWADATMDVTWSWDAREDAAQYRLRVDDGPWHYLDGDETRVTTSSLASDSDPIFILEYTVDGDDWSAPIAGSLSDEQQSVMLTLDIRSQAPFIRWKVDDGPWTSRSFDPSTSTIVLGPLAGGVPVTITLEKSEDGLEWQSASQRTTIPHAVRLPSWPDAVEDKGASFSLRASFSPLSYGIYDFFNGHDISQRALTVSKYGLAAALEFGWNITDSVQLYLAGGYSLIQKGSTIIPDAETVHNASAMLGLDFRLFKAGDFSMRLGISSGALVQFNAGVVDTSPTVSARLGFDYEIIDGLTIGLQPTFTASYIDDPDPLYRSMSYLVDAVGLTVEKRF